MSQVIASHTCHGVYNGLVVHIGDQYALNLLPAIGDDCSSQDICVVSPAVLRGLNGHELLASLGIIHL
jgi:hypothetical protein